MCELALEFGAQLKNLNMCGRLLYNYRLLLIKSDDCLYSFE